MRTASGIHNRWRVPPPTLQVGSRTSSVSTGTADARGQVCGSVPFSHGRSSPGSSPCPGAKKGTSKLHQGDEVKVHLRKAVVSAVDFHQNTVPVWDRRVTGIEEKHNRLRHHTVADRSFLERAMTKVTTCLDEIHKILDALKPFTAGPQMASDWGMYAQRSSKLLVAIEALVGSMRTRIERLLQFSTPSTGWPLQWVSLPPSSNPRSRPNTSCGFARSGLGSGRTWLSSSKKFSSYGSPSRERLSNVSTPEMHARQTGSNTDTTPLRWVRSPLRCYSPGSERSSSRSIFFQPGQQQQRDFPRFVQHHSSLTHISAKDSNFGANAWLSARSAHSRVKEPFYEHHMVKKPQTKGFRGDLSNAGNYTNYTASNSATNSEWLKCMKNALERTNSSRFLSRCNGGVKDRNVGMGVKNLHPDQRRALLERLHTMGKSFPALSDADKIEAESIFKGLYGSRSWSRQYSEWMDDLAMRALRQR